MNSKKILNRTLPLIIALAVILLVAILATVLTGSKKTAKVTDGDSDYLVVDLGTSDLGYAEKIAIKKSELYDTLKTQSGLTVLVDLIDTKILTEKGYLQKVTDDEVKEAVEEAIFTGGYDSDAQEYDAAVTAIKNYIDRMYVYYGIEINPEHIVINENELQVNLTGEDDLRTYYALTIARRAFARDRLGEDQKESYETFIDEYETYLEELHKYENDEITTAPTAPTDASTITASSVQTDYESNNTDSYWTLLATYSTTAAAQKALLQVGVVIFSGTWYEYAGLDPETNLPYTSLHYTASVSTVKRLDKFEIMEKMIQLYNNQNDENLVEDTHYTVGYKTVAEYDALEDNEKAYYTKFNITNAEYDASSNQTIYTKETITESAYDDLTSYQQTFYTVVDEEAAEKEYECYTAYRGIIFATEIKYKEEDGEQVVDKDNTLNKLYFESADLTSIDSTILSYVRSLTSANTYNSTWSKCYTTSIQSKGSYYVLGVKLATVSVDSFEDVYGTLYDDEAYEADGTIKDLGYVTFTGTGEDKVFDYTASDYWKKVEELLDDAVTTTIINRYMAEARYDDYGLIIYDDSLETSYTSTYTSDYKTTKKTSSTLIARLTWKDADGAKQTYDITPDMLYTTLEKNSGSITAVDAFQYQYILYQSDMVDYGKYVDGASLEDCVIITEYALANKGSSEAITSWKKVSSDGTVSFTKVDGTKAYDVLVRTSTSRKDRKVNVDSELTAVMDDATSTRTTAVVTVYEDEEDISPETRFNALDEQIEALHLYFVNGNFADYGYDASYGWKNFLNDYFATYYGIKVDSIEALKLYYIYEDSISTITTDLAATTEDTWNNVYLPYMQQMFDDYYSVSVINFVIGVNDSEGSPIDPDDEDAETKWTEAQKNAAKDLYKKIVEILKKTRDSEQSSVLQEIVDEFDAAPYFIDGAGETTKEQQDYINGLKNSEGNNLYYSETYSDSQVEYVTTIKGVELELSYYKTLGLTLTAESAATYTNSSSIVERFSDALRMLWLDQNSKDSGMQEGTALTTNVFYDDYVDNNNDEFLTTEFGYHVIVAKTFTGRPTATNTDRKTVVVGLPTLANVLIYEENGEEVDDLTTLETAEITNYYANIQTDFAGSYYYQISMMKKSLEMIQADQFTGINKENATKVLNYYIDTYYGNMTYIKQEYDNAKSLLEISTRAMEHLMADYEGATRENLTIILAATDKALLTDIDSNTDYTTTQKEEYKESLDAYNEVLAEYNAWLANITEE